MAEATGTTNDVLVSTAPAMSATSDEPLIEATPDAQTDPAKPAADAAPAKAGEGKEPADKPATGAEGEPGAVDDEGKPDLTPIGLKRAITAEKDRRRTVEAALAAKDAQLTQALEALNKTAPKVEPPPVKAAPKPEDFDSPEEYDAARIDYAVDRKLEARLAADKAAAEQRAAQEAQQSAQQRFNTSMNAARAKNADFAEVIAGATSPVTPAMRDAIIDSNIGGEILYHLAKNKAEAERIAALPAVAAIREIGKIEAALTAPPPAATPGAAPTKPAVSNAPDPVRTVGASNQVEVNLADLPIAEYARKTAELRKAGISY